ncbi:hypothetical protein LTR53_017437 [Teratosphaeriaceae sp. CCFEE 6253]|nr:hypothetical protein LTR53_017437 [Teratosphaeriaceae sp. CCFEE 6253]
MAAMDDPAHSPDQERSPSPPPLPPTASAPGPRATALTTLYHDAITHLLKTCSYPAFAACFPTPARAVPGSMIALHGQFTTKLGEKLVGEFDELMRERGAVGALNGLDRLIEDARARKARAEVEGVGGKGVPPHTLPPQTLYLSHLAPQLRGWSRETQSAHAMVQTENAELLARIQQQRADIARMVAGLENVVADLDASVAALDSQEMDGLREEAMGVDEAMRMEA